MNAVIDRFGKDARVSDMGDGTACVSVAAMATPVFFGWISQFAGQIVVESPSSLRQGYADYLRDLLRDYEERHRVRPVPFCVQQLRVVLVDSLLWWKGISRREPYGPTQS